MATKEEIFEWIRYTCITDTDAEQVAEIVATKMAEENNSSNNAMVQLLKGIRECHTLIDIDNWYHNHFAEIDRILEKCHQ